MNLGPTNWDIPRSREAQLHAIPFDLQHNDLDVLANEDSLAGFAAKNQHLFTLPTESLGALPLF